MTLGLKAGRFHRNARLHCLNLLLTYGKGCLGTCAYCGLGHDRSPPAGGSQPGPAGGGRRAAKRRVVLNPSFIRVEWPTHSMDEVVERLQPLPPELERACISMVTRRRAVDDVRVVARRIREAAPGLPISLLVAPTAMASGDAAEVYASFREAGASHLGIAVDAATPALFERYRGAGVGGPHKWERYWESIEAALRVFGEGRVGLHLIVGLGETEREMVGTIARARGLGARTHLFSFFPEEGSALAGGSQPPVGHYRRVQLARFLIDEEIAASTDMTFDDSGKLTGFGADADVIDDAIDSGLPFRTSGCPGKTVIGMTEVAACNRPYANCLPGSEIRNFPFQPDADDIALVRRQLSS